MFYRKNKIMVKKKHICYLVLLMFSSSLTGQGVHPKDWGLKDFQMTDPTLGEINFYVSEKGIDQDKPVLLLFSGTRGLPTMLVVESGDKSYQLGTVPPDLIFSFTDHFHVVFIGKVGTPFCDTMKTESFNPLQNLEDYQPSREYVLNCGKEWELAASSLVIDEVITRLPNSSKRMVVLGASEGGHTAIYLAAENKNITHLVSVVSGGLNQWFSSVINRRIDAAKGEISHQEAQDEIDKLFATYKEIYSDPDNTEKWYYGHPYKRWGSFCSTIPLDELVKLDIPILFVNGSADRNNPILQSDYVMLEFLRLGKTNLTYHVIPGADHWFNETIEEEGERKHISHRKDAFNFILDWLVSDPQ
jgi:hypothetical protein